MREYFKKLWYFVFPIIVFVLEPIGEWMVMRYFDEVKVEAWLQKSFTLSQLLPWIALAIAFAVCAFVFIMKHHGEVKTVITPESLQNLASIMEQTVNEMEYIESIQAFQYSLKNDRDARYIKLSFLTGRADERIEINTILQTYYAFSYITYKKLKAVSMKYDTYKAALAKDPGKAEEAFDEFRSAGMELLEYMTSKLGEIDSVDKINKFHCEMYRASLCLLSAILKKPVETLLEKPEIEEALIRCKKTGIIGSIIFDDIFVFRNQTSLIKKGRIYFTFPYDHEKKIIMIGAINGSCLPHAQVDTISQYAEDVVNHIHRLSQSQEP